MYSTSTRLLKHAPRTLTCDVAFLGGGGGCTFDPRCLIDSQNICDFLEPPLWSLSFHTTTTAMPPKPRGGGSTRARGGARGGSTAARDTAAARESVDDATPQSTAPAAATGDAAEPVVPKQEDNESKPAVSGESTVVAGDSHASPSAAVESPQPGAEPSARAPVQRLGSLQGSVPPSRSASPSVRGRGGTARGKRGVKTPAFTGRRSKEERDAIAKEQAARDRERTKEQVAADKRREADALRAARREANKQKNARGGFSGVASGPFSLGSSREGMADSPDWRDYANCGCRQEEQPESWVRGFRCRIRLSS